jgi:hypothetical protein
LAEARAADKLRFATNRLTNMADRIGITRYRYDVADQILTVKGEMRTQYELHRLRTFNDPSIPIGARCDLLNN